MTNRIYGGLIAVAVVLLLAWNATFVVNEKEQAVVLRFGQIQRVIDAPGLNFKLPFGFAGADTVRKLPDRLLRFDLDDIRVQVSGGKFYEVDAFLVYNIADAADFVRSVSGSIPQAEQRLRTRLDAALRRVYGLRGFEAALSDERADMMRQVRDQIRPDAASLGIELTDVRIRRTDLTQEVSQQTYERMQAERLAEAERLRARGQVAARQIRAAADREVVETKAAAQREAEILQGEGDAERNRNFATAYGANPEFFEFYRSMQAYRQALENSGTTMVLSPDSEFFQYFKSTGESVMPQATAASGSDGAAGATGMPDAADTAAGAGGPEADTSAPDSQTEVDQPEANAAPASGTDPSSSEASATGPTDPQPSASAPEEAAENAAVNSDAPPPTGDTAPESSPSSASASERAENAGSAPNASTR